MKKKTRLLSVIMALIIAMSIFSAVPFTVSAEEARLAETALTDEAYPDYEYRNNNGGAEITKYNGTEENITVPSTIGGLPVKYIGQKSFYSNKNIKSVKLPDTVTSIGTAAFFYCINLKSVELPDDLTYIGSSAFEYCTYLFRLHIPSKVTKIEPTAFLKCALLSYIDVDPDNTVYDSREDCSAIIETDTNTLMLTSLNTVIPESVTALGYRVFAQRDAMKQYTIPDSIRDIGLEAFSECTALTDITFGKSVETVGEGAFSYCSKLTYVELPDSTVSIGENAFMKCTQLERIKIPASVTTIDNAFSGCDKLVIEGSVGSQAQKYAVEHNIPFFDTDYIRVASVSLSKSSAKIKTGESLKLKATVSPENAFFKELSWSSSDSSVASVDRNGTVYGKTAGEAVITVNAADGKSASCAVTVNPGPEEPESELIPKPNNNLYNSLIRNTYLTPTSDGYMRLFCSGDNNNEDKKLYIEYYSPSFNLKSRRELELELPVWGGFYDGSDAYYLVEGQNNKDCVDDTEVVRIIKYSKDWERLGSGSIKALDGWDYEIRYPFKHGCVNMAELEGKLYVITGREGYVDPQYGQGHQGMMLIRVDEQTMESDIIYGDFWHSFAQHICSLGRNLYTLELSEGSQCTSITRFDPRLDCDYFGEHPRFSVLDYGGQRTSAWAVATYAGVDGIAAGTKTILGAGISIDQSEYDNYSYGVTPYNVYLTVTPVDDFTKEASKLIWITDYTEYRNIDMVRLLKINDNRFMLMWNEAFESYASEDSPEYKAIPDYSDCLTQNTMHYVFIDAEGNKLGDEFTADASVSQCTPAVDGSKIVFCSSDYSTVDFYTIDAYTGKFGKKVYNVVGEQATWETDGETIVFSGKGEVTVNPGFAENNDIKKLVFSDGLTSISSISVGNLKNLDTVIYEGDIDRVSTLDNSYRYYSQNSGWYYIGYTEIKDIYIYGDIRNVDDEAFDSCFSSVFHCNRGTEIDKYLKANGFTVRYLDEVFYKISGKVKSYLSDADPVNLLLSKDGNIIYNINITGNSAEFKFDNLAEGTYILRVAKKNHVTRDYRIKVSDGDVICDAVINPLGDINGDGKTTQFDYSFALAYTRKAKELSSYQIKCGDVFGYRDGKLTTSDASRILQHVRKINLLY